MDVTFFPCSACGEMLKLHSDLAKAGEKIICPVCDAEVVVPPAEKRVVNETPTVVRQKVDPSVAAPKKNPPPSQPPAQKRRSLAFGRWLVKHPKAALRVCVPLVIILALGLTRIWLVRAAEGRIDRIIDGVSESAAVSYGGIKVGLLGRSVSVNDVRIKPREKPRLISIDRLEARYAGWGEGAPGKLQLEALGLHVPLYPETMGAFGPAMKKLEYYSLPIHLTLAYEYQEEAGTLVVERCDLICPGVGDIRATAQLSGVDLQKGVSSNQLWGLYESWHIDEAFLEYCDDSLVARFIDYQAKYIGESTEELQAGMLADLDEVIRIEWDADTKGTLLTFREFLQNSRYVAIVSEPPAPIAIVDLIDVYDQQGLKGLVPMLKMKLSVDSPYSDRPDTDWVPVEPPQDAEGTR